MKNHNFEKTIENCSLCELGKTKINCDCGKMYGFGGNEKNIMIVGINPSIRRDVGTKYAMYTDTINGTSEGLLKKCLNELGFTYEDLYFTNLLKCSTDENEKPEISNTNTCFDTFFMQEFSVNFPRSIFCLGSFVYEYLSDQRRVNDYANLYKVYHHAYIKRSPDKYDEWKEQFIRGIKDGAC